MTAMLQARPASGTPSQPRLDCSVFTARKTRVVHIAGELDLATRSQLVAASTAGHDPAVWIDLGGVTFMDCAGYRALVASRRIIEGEGRSLRITGQTRQPARFLDLIAELEQGPLQPA